MPIGKLIKRLFSGQVETVDPTPDKAPHWISNPWHAVSVVPCKGACIVARQSTGMRFLSKEAPPLPFAGCTAPACTCRYRRSLRRASDVMASAAHWGGRERREAPGRRLTDQA